ncbi:MAG: type II secretion system protein [Thermodesulfobacteriota bacterium]|nr:type II secretion system protein [Thermodesulfobacteriota bacterium]
MTIFGSGQEKPGWIRRSFLHERGYTFIELTIVILLIGSTLALAIPRFRYSLLTDDLKSTTRKLTAIIKNLRNQAVREQNSLTLHFDLGSNRFWIDSEDMTEEERLLIREKATSLPSGVRILDVWSNIKGKKMAGEATILFNKKGYMQPSAIHLGSEDGSKFTLVLSPFLRKVTVLKGYLDFEDV